MSAEREFVDDREIKRVPADAPIRAIAPDDFVARSSKQTFRAALRKLERETSRRPAEMPRCPECGTINIRRKSDHAAPGNRIDTAFRCASHGCRAHFDEPAPPREEVAPGEQATLPGVRER